ncbi:MAG TPA: hypothetical protein VK306_01245 [Acidimicrobiales bacterium]|nr:hypothetical protein [Acidimicrobiales bacterium]
MSPAVIHSRRPLAMAYPRTRSTTRSARPRARRLGVTVATLAALASAACDVQTAVDVTMADDGSGTVAVAVRLDEEALAEVPDADGDGVSGPADLDALLRTDDMAAVGWDVAAPEESDGLTLVRATKPFGTPEEGVAVLGEITGAEGALHDLRMDRTKGFASTSYHFAGTIDLSGGLETFGDAGLAELLDGEPLGEDVAAIEQRLGEPLTDVFSLDVTVTLPGSVDPGTGNVDGGRVRWTSQLGGGARELAASSRRRDLAVLALTAVAAVTSVTGIALLGRRLLRRS